MIRPALYQTDVAQLTSVVPNRFLGTAHRLGDLADPEWTVGCPKDDSPRSARFARYRQIDEEFEPEPGPESITVNVTNSQPIEISVLKTERIFSTDNSYLYSRPYRSR